MRSPGASPDSTPTSSEPSSPPATTAGAPSSSYPDVEEYVLPASDASENDTWIGVDLAESGNAETSAPPQSSAGGTTPFHSPTMARANEFLGGIDDLVALINATQDRPNPSTQNSRTVLAGEVVRETDAPAAPNETADTTPAPARSPEQGPSAVPAARELDPEMTTVLAELAGEAQAPAADDLAQPTENTIPPQDGGSEQSPLPSEQSPDIGTSETRDHSVPLKGSTEFLMDPAQLSSLFEDFASAPPKISEEHGERTTPVVEPLVTAGDTPSELHVPSLVDPHHPDQPSDTASETDAEAGDPTEPLAGADLSLTSSGHELGNQGAKPASPNVDNGGQAPAPDTPGEEVLNEGATAVPSNINGGIDAPLAGVRDGAGEADPASLTTEIPETPDQPAPGNAEVSPVDPAESSDDPRPGSPGNPVYHERIMLGDVRGQHERFGVDGGPENPHVFQAVDPDRPPMAHEVVDIISKNLGAPNAKYHVGDPAPTVHELQLLGLNDAEIMRVGEGLFQAGLIRSRDLTVNQTIDPDNSWRWRRRYPDRAPQDLRFMVREELHRVRVVAQHLGPRDHIEQAEGPPAERIAATVRALVDSGELAPGDFHKDLFTYGTDGQRRHTHVALMSLYLDGYYQPTGPQRSPGEPLPSTIWAKHVHKTLVVAQKGLAQMGLEIVEGNQINHEQLAYALATGVVVGELPTGTVLPLAAPAGHAIWRTEAVPAFAYEELGSAKLVKEGKGPIKNFVVADAPEVGILTALDAHARSRGWTHRQTQKQFESSKGLRSSVITPEIAAAHALIGTADQYANFPWKPLSSAERARHLVAMTIATQRMTDRHEGFPTDKEWLAKVARPLHLKPGMLASAFEALHADGILKHTHRIAKVSGAVTPSQVFDEAVRIGEANRSAGLIKKTGKRLGF